MVIQTRWVMVVVLGWVGVSFVVSCREGQKGIREEATTGATTRPVVAEGTAAAPSEEELRGMGFSFAGAPSSRRSAEEVAKGSAACVACHTGTDSHTMHVSDQGISCVDCHGGR